MRLLHVAASLSVDSIGRLMVDLLPRFRDKGYEVALLVFDGTRTPFYEMLEEKGITIYSLGVGGNVYDLRHIWRLRKFLRKFDIVHTHNTACQLFVPIAKILSAAKCRLITTEHNTFNRRRKMWFFKPIDRWMYHRYSNILAISQQAADNLDEYLNGIYPIDVVENGIDLSQFSGEPRKWPLVGEETIVTMVAGFRPQKDQDTLVTAMGYMPDNFKLWLIGDGELRKDIEERIHFLKLDDKVTMWGVRSDVPELMEKSHLIVQSSLYEGLSLASVEAMASGAAVMATDVPGHREVVGGAGVLFEPREPRDLAWKMIDVMCDEDVYNKVVEDCLRRAQDYDIDVTADMYHTAYQEK